MDHPNAESPPSNATTSLVGYHDQQADECIARIEKYQRQGRASLAKPPRKMTEEECSNGEFPWNNGLITRNAESQPDPNTKPSKPRQGGMDATPKDVLEDKPDLLVAKPAEVQRDESPTQAATSQTPKFLRNLVEAEANAKRSAPFASYTTTMQLPDGRWITRLNICTDTAALPRPQVCWKGSVTKRDFLTQVMLFMNRFTRIFFQQSEGEDEMMDLEWGSAGGRYTVLVFMKFALCLALCYFGSGD